MLAKHCNLSLSLSLSKTEHLKGPVVPNQPELSKSACISYEPRSGLAQGTEDVQ